MISHGFVSSGLFITATILYDRFHSRIIRYYRGIAISMPIFSYLFILLILANVSFPGSLNFWGELIALKSCIDNKIGFYLSLSILISVIIGAIYSFNLVNKMIFGYIGSLLYNIRDLNKREFNVIILVTFLPWATGVFPY